MTTITTTKTMKTLAGNVMKELHTLLGKADKLYNGQVEFVFDDCVEDKNEENGNDLNMDQWNVIPEDDEITHDIHVFFYITPKEGIFKNARIKFHMCVNTLTYPNDAPIVTCLNKVYHPNIGTIYYHEKEAEVCVSLLGDDWHPEVGLDGAVMAILFLFYHPDHDDPLNEMSFYDIAYEFTVRQTLQGHNIGGFEFDKVVEECSDTNNDDEITHRPKEHEQSVPQKNQTRTKSLLFSGLRFGYSKLGSLLSQIFTIFTNRS